MIALRKVWLIAAMLVGTLAGCLGGSGSSGFDLENAAIEEAIDTQECQNFEGLEICPAQPAGEAKATPTATPTYTPIQATSTPVHSATPPVNDTPTLPTPGVSGTPTRSPLTTPTPTITPRAEGTPTRAVPTVPPSMQVVTNIGPSSDINCSNGSECSFRFIYVATGFPPDAAYRTASRGSADDVWTISEPDMIDASESETAFQDRVPIAAPSGAPAGETTTVQFAVLVFFDDPGTVPSTVRLLGDTGADFAYVQAPVPVSTIAF